MKKGVLGSALLWIVLLVIIISIVAPFIYRQFMAAEQTTTLGTSCEVGGLGKGTCRQKCGPEEIPSVLACDTGICCVGTGSGDSAAGTADAQSCQTPGDINECPDRMICNDQKICEAYCTYCINNPGESFCKSGVTPQHSCGCTLEQANSGAFSEIQGLCPSTNPGDSDYMCCTNQMSIREQLASSNPQRHAAVKDQQLDDLVSSLEACHQSNTRCNHAGVLVRQLITDPSWQMLFMNSGSSSKVKIAQTTTTSRGDLAQLQGLTKNINVPVTNLQQPNVPNVRLYMDNGKICVDVQSFFDGRFDKFVPDDDEVHVDYVPSLGC